MIWEDPTVWESQGRFIHQVTELDCQDVSKESSRWRIEGRGHFRKRDWPEQKHRSRESTRH